MLQWEFLELSVTKNIHHTATLYIYSCVTEIEIDAMLDIITHEENKGQKLYVTRCNLIFY